MTTYTGLRTPLTIFKDGWYWGYSSLGYCPHPVTLNIRGHIKGSIHLDYEYYTAVTEWGQHPIVAKYYTSFLEAPIDYLVPLWLFLVCVVNHRHLDRGLVPEP